MERVWGSFDRDTDVTEEAQKAASKSRMKQSTRSWRGEIFVGPRAGIFRGGVGDNAMHAHGAHQVSVGLDDVMTLHCGAQSVRGRAVFVAASCCHQINGGTTISIYADVSSDLGIAMRDATRSHGPFSVLSDQVGERLAVVGSTVRALTTDVVAEIALAFGNPTAHEPDPALAQITRVLSDAMRRGATPSRADLATAVGLSESRFSHWFRERAGMPMQTYRKWQRLALAVERILDGEPMASAAHLAGFADQAHFIRTFRGMFGINPLAALGARRAL